MADTQIKLKQIGQSGATSGQVISWSGTEWVPAAVGTVTSVGITPPSQGITVSGSPITSSGSITLALSDDLAAIENLSSTGIAVRTGTSTWTTRTIAVSTSYSHGFASDILVTNGSGVSGNPVISPRPAYYFTWKASVRVATTANLSSLSGLLTIDGVTVSAGDRVLVKNQTTASQNGIYVAASGSWSRALDADTTDMLECSSWIYVREGTTNKGKIFRLTTTHPITVGTTALNYSEVTLGGNGIYGGSGSLTGTTTTVTMTSTQALIFKQGSEELFGIRPTNSDIFLYNPVVNGFSSIILEDKQVSLTGFDTSSTPDYNTLTVTPTYISLAKKTKIEALRYASINASIGADQNDYSATNFDRTSLVGINPSSDGLKVSGIVTHNQSGTVLFITNTSTSNGLILLDESTSSSSANRFRLGGDVLLLPGDIIALQYTNSRWTLLSPPRALYPAQSSGLSTGMKAYFTANEAHQLGDLVRLNGSNTVTLASASSYSNALVIAMATESVSTSSRGTYLLRGFISNSSWSFTVGAPVYLSTSGTSGNTLTQTKPTSSGTIVLPVGYAVSATTLYFNPSMTLLENA